MNRLLMILCLSLMSTAVFAQTSPSDPSAGGLAVFATYASAEADDGIQAGFLPGNMTTRTVLFAGSDARLSYNLGLAIVNPWSTAINVTLTLRRGGNGTTSSETTITLGPRQHVSKFIRDLFADMPQLPLEVDGSLMVTSANPFAIAVAHFRGTNFNTIPITSLSYPMPVPVVAAGVGGNASIMLPQFAIGGGWTSELLLSNTTADQMRVRVDLFKDDGTPLTTKVNGQTGSSFTNLIIPAQGSLILSSLDINVNGALQTGYAIVTPAL